MDAAGMERAAVFGVCAGIAGNRTRSVADEIYSEVAL